MSVECWVLREFDDVKILLAAVIEEGIASREIADLQNCTVKWSFRWFLCRCALSNLSSLALGVACRDCSKQTVLSFIEQKLAAWPPQIRDKVSARMQHIYQQMQLEQRFHYLENLIKTGITSMDQRLNKQLEVWNALYNQVEALCREIAIWRESVQANQVELKKLIEAQAKEIEALKKNLEEIHIDLVKGLSKIDLCLFEQKIAHLRTELQQIGGRFHSSGVRGSRIPLLIRETHPG